MAVSRWDPFRDLMSIQSELNRLFGRTYGGEGGETVHGASWAPPLDVYETGDRFVINVEIPGVSADQVDISVEDSTLMITGQRTFYEGISEESFHRVERRFGTFGRTLSLPSNANLEGIEASFDAGILTIEVPKVEEAKPKKVQIKARG